MCVRKKAPLHAALFTFPENHNHSEVQCWENGGTKVSLDVDGKIVPNFKMLNCLYILWGMLHFRLGEIKYKLDLF